MTAETNGAYTVTLHVKDKGNYAMAHKLLTIEAEPLPEVGNVKLKWVGLTYWAKFVLRLPAVSDDNNVYMTSNDHYLRKFSAATGEQLWSSTYGHRLTVILRPVIHTPPEHYGWYCVCRNKRHKWQK